MLALQHDEIALYMQRAWEMLEVAAHNTHGGYYGSAINRAYYAVFYAAGTLLVTQGVGSQQALSGDRIVPAALYQAWPIGG